MKRYLVLLAIIAAVLPLRADISLDECQRLARENYPLIRQYGLLQRTRDIDLSDINKSWLPRVEVYAQGTVQNAVPSFPDELRSMLTQMGQSFDGLNKFQYKGGVELAQTIWDGGESKARREQARARTAAGEARLDVELYGIRQRVQNLYFSRLLLDSQIETTRASIALLDSNITELNSLLRGGVAIPADVAMVKAERLSMAQKLVEAESQRDALTEMLGVFTGRNLAAEKFLLPDASLPADTANLRPEQQLFSRQLELNSAMRRSVKASLMPKIGLFGSAYYGYPGLDYFKSMRDKKPTFNALAGVKISWNLGSLYQRDNTLRRLDISDESILSDRDVFDFNIRLQTRQEMKEIEGLRKVVENDAEIVALRAEVRQTAESQLRHGIIDPLQLTVKINDENRARLTQSYNRISLIQKIYNLKNTLNR